MMSVLLAMCFALAAVAASAVRLQRIHAALSFDVDALRVALGRTADASMVALLGALLSEECGTSWEAELVVGLGDATSKPVRTAIVNETLHDVGSLLDWGAPISKAAPRCAAAGPLGVLFWSLARQTLTVSEVLPVMAWGASGVALCLLLAHQSQRLVIARRRSIDMWVDQLLIAAEIR